MSQIRHARRAPTGTQQRAGGDVIDRHRHDDHQLIYVSAGVLAIRTAGGSWVVSQDRAVLVPAGIWHEHQFHGATSFHTVGFAADLWTSQEPVPVMLGVDGFLRELLIAASDTAELSTAETRRLQAVLLDRLHRAAAQPLVLPAARDPRLVQVCRLVEDDLSCPRSLSWLAVRANTSERTLARLFRAEFSTTYPQWRTTLRTFRAMVLLAHGETVTRTGHACGWGTTSAFVDSFSRTMGRTPGQYRAAQPR